MKKSVVMIAVLMMALGLNGCDADTAPTAPAATTTAAETTEAVTEPETTEVVNLRGDTTTLYKLADGTYMDRETNRYTYNGTDAWFDENGVEWNEVAK